MVNLSAGRQGSSHDGYTLVEMAFDELLTQRPGCCIVKSAGNYFDKNIHAMGALAAGQTATLRLLVDAADITPNELEVWYPGADEYSVNVECPRGFRSAWVALGEREELVRDGRLIARIYHRKADPNNGDNLINMFIYPGAPAGEWRVTLRARRTAGRDSVFHAWVERDDACLRCQTVFRPEDANSFWTLGTLASSAQAIVVGAYDGRPQTSL